MAVLLPLYHGEEIATVAVASVFTTVVAAADSTPTKTMPKTAMVSPFQTSLTFLSFLLLAVLLPLIQCGEIAR